MMHVEQIHVTLQTLVQSMQLAINSLLLLITRLHALRLQLAHLWESSVVLITLC